jgi:hypothetical protein
MLLSKRRPSARSKNRIGDLLILVSAIAATCFLPSAILAQSSTSGAASRAGQSTANLIVPSGLLSSKIGNPGSGNLSDSEDPKTAHPVKPTPEATPKKSENKDEATLEEITHLKSQLVEQQGQLAEQQRQIDQLRTALEAQQKLIGGAAGAQPANTGALDVKAIAAGTSPVVGDATAPVERTTKADAQDEGPLQFKIGRATIMPVGFLDFTAYLRTTNTNGAMGTNYGNIPFSNQIGSKLTEFRARADNSRIGARIDADVKDTHVIGYFEMDFLGNNAANIAVTSNSVTNRLRLYWADLRKDKLELLGGQSWSLMTPNRKGLSPFPGDIFYTQNEDANYQAGLVWARQPQFRVVYHANDTTTVGISFENPDQFIGGGGGGGPITLPAGLNANYANELDAGNLTLAAPNVIPDIIAKVAFDPKIGGRDFHFEAAGLLRTFRVYNSLTDTHFSKAGAGGSLNLNFEVVKNFRFITNNFYSDGGGRYIFGLAPDLVVKSDGSLSLVHSGSTVTGFEATVDKTWILFGYYGGVYVGRNVVIDTSPGAKPGSRVGYGFSGSGNTQNRVIHEGTFGFNHTIWRDAKYGALQTIGQYSYLLRHAWFVAPNQPKDAHTNMLFFSLRYVLPGSAPKLK